MQLTRVSAPTHSENPVVITDSSWYRLVDDIAISLATSREPLLWLAAGRGAGKSAWLQALLPALQGGSYQLDARNRQQTADALAYLIPLQHNAQAPSPVLVLDNLSPSDLMALVAEPTHPMRTLMTQWSGPLLLLSPAGGSDNVAARRLERVTGRSLVRHDLPVSSRSQNRSILVAHRPRLEARWNVRITDAAMGLAVSGLKYRTSPGEVVEWLGRASARVSLLADEGPGERRRLRAELETLADRLVANRETGESVTELEQEYQGLSLELAAADVDWLERQAQGSLRHVLPEDLQFELESLTGTSDHPELHVPTEVAGGVLSAGSGNLRS